MKLPIFLLALGISFTCASQSTDLNTDLSTELQETSLERRVYGNLPGDEGYRPRDDPKWEGNNPRGGRGYTIAELWRQHDRAEEDDEDPPEPLRPAQVPQARRQSTSNSHHSSRPRPARQAQSKRTSAIAYKYTSEKENGDARVVELGAQFPLPKQGPQAYTKGIIHGSVDQGTFAPGGRVGVNSLQTVGTKYGAGPFYVDASYSKKQNLNPAPAPRPQPVYAEAGSTDTYYMNRRGGGTREVYRGDDGRLYSARSDRPLHGSPNVYINNPSRRRRSKRSPANVLGTIEATTNDPTNSTSSLAGDWQTFYRIYTGLRTNATNLIMPILQDVVSKSNTSYTYEMVWSIHSHLTGSPNEYQDGPYDHGLSSLDDFQDYWLLQAGFWLDNNGTIYNPGNSSITNDTMLWAGQMLGVTDYLQETYYETWDLCVKAINVTQDGSKHTLFDSLVYFSAVVTATNDTSVLNENFYTVDLNAAAAEAKWFVDGMNEFW